MAHGTAASALVWPVYALVCLPVTLQAQERSFRLEGNVVGAGGKALAGAVVTAGNNTGPPSDTEGRFTLIVPRGIARVLAHADGYAAFTAGLDVESDRSLHIELRRNESVTVHAGRDVLEPDPASSAYTREDLLPANPGRPGVPFSVPGFPTESASGGIKAPQYFAPGVAGDHGEPIAQYF